MNKTLIEWVKNPDGTQGYTWNPITGCLNGCEYCYARRLANGRLKPLYLANTQFAIDPLSKKWMLAIKDPFYPRFWPERIFDNRGQYIHLADKPTGIFVCDMGELFGDWIPDGWQEHVFNFIKLNPNHRFYLLTKQPQNLPVWSPFSPNVYVGISVTNQKQFDEAIKYLKQIKATVKFISFEPLLGHIILD